MLDHQLLWYNFIYSIIYVGNLIMQDKKKLYISIRTLINNNY